MTRHYHPVYSSIAARDSSRAPRPFQVRDGLASALVACGLRKHGFELGDVFLNFPPPQNADSARIHVDTSMCLLGDLLGQTTRPPEKSEFSGCRKRVQRAYTDLEDDMTGVWQPWLPVIARDLICLSEELCERLPAGFRDRAEMGFYEKIGAPYRTLRARDARRRRGFRGNEPRTAAFLLRVPTLAERKTGYLGTWGLDGSATLVWACWLRENPELLGAPGFVMAELVGGSTPARPTDLGWTREWGVEILIHVPIEEGPKPSDPVHGRPQPGAA